MDQCIKFLTKYNQRFIIYRYEAPDNKNRWDVPLFNILPEDELKFDDIYKSLYEVKAPKPNLSTQCVSINIYNELII